MRRRPVRSLVFKLVAGVSWLVLLVVAIRSGGKLAESRQKIDDLSSRLKIAAESEPSISDDLLKAHAEVAALKEALSTRNGEIEQMQKHSALKREQVLLTAAKERKTLTAGIAKVLSRFGFSQEELETLLADLSAEDRRHLLEQITELKATTPVVPEEPRTTEVEVTPSSDDKPEEKALVVPESKPETAPTTEEPIKRDESKPVTYTVKSGDNLTRIARRFDVNVAQLMKHNQIRNANMLRVGQVLKIPQN